jgi:flagellar basal body-associated protein FliL
MSEEESNASGSNTSVVIVIVLLLLGLPCLAGVAILGGTVVFLSRSVATRAADEEQRARVAAEFAKAAALSRAAASDAPVLSDQSESEPK